MTDNTISICDMTKMTTRLLPDPEERTEYFMTFLLDHHRPTYRKLCAFISKHHAIQTQQEAA